MPTHTQERLDAAVVERLDALVDQLDQLTEEVRRLDRDLESLRATVAETMTAAPWREIPEAYLG